MTVCTLSPPFLANVNSRSRSLYAIAQGHREFPFGNSREFPGIADPKIPGGNSRKFLKFWRELRGIYGSFVFFTIFIVDYDILVFNLTHCIKKSIMCTTQNRLTAFWAKPWMTSLTQLFVFIEFRHTIEKSLNSVRISQTQIVTRMRTLRF